jgi:GT2 family glycosyltransferase
MNENPLVSVNILSFNRKDELRNTLQKVFEQDYKNIEVIVVDNASNDGSADMVKLEYPDIQLIQLEKNTGIAGWNEGFKVAKGEYVLVLDDDAYPDKITIKNAILCARSKEKIGIVVLRIFDKKKNMIINERNNNEAVLSFIGCGALIHRNVFRNYLFNENIFIYEHEVDYSLRVSNSGYILIYCNNSFITHSNSVLNRNFIKSTDHRRVFYTSRNISYILLSYFSHKKVLFRLIRIFLGRLFLSIPKFCSLTVVKGFYSGVKLYLSEKNRMNRVSDEIQKRYSYGAFAGGFLGQKGMLK